MENKIIKIEISPNSTDETTQNAGVMWEHNATSIVFNIDSAYIGNYKYYLEYRSIIGTKVRTEYLRLNPSTSTIIYNIPVSMSSLRCVECYFNIVEINDDGQTVMVVKPKKFCIDFDYSPDTDNSLAKVNDFSINALLEAIRLGKFKGDSGVWLGAEEPPEGYNVWIVTEKSETEPDTPEEPDVPDEPEVEPILPSEYQEVEYIEGDGTQYIVTDVNAESGLTFEIGAQLTYAKSLDNCVVGARTSDQRLYAIHNYAYKFVAGYGEYYQATVASDTKYHDFKTVLETGNQKLYIDNEEVPFNSSEWGNNTTEINLNIPIIICGGIKSDLSFVGGQVKIYYVRIYKNDELISNFIPCYRINDSKSGMYDLVSETFYVNAGDDGTDFVVGDIM